MKVDAFDNQCLERTREVCQKLFHGNYITEYVFAFTSNKVLMQTIFGCARFLRE